MLVLVIGDLHIPHRAADLPTKFRSLLVPGKIHHVLCTGNLVDDSTYEYLRSISPHVTAVRGDYDATPGEGASVRGATSTVELGSFQVGVAHADAVVPRGDRGAIAALQRRLGVDILAIGGQGGFQAYRQQGRFVIVPGSATGAAADDADPAQSPVPSFVLMDLDGGKATVYVYELVDGEVKVDKIEFAKTPQV